MTITTTKKKEEIMAYCPQCDEQVVPKKKTNWLLLIALVVSTGFLTGAIIYCLYETFFMKPDHCPHCKKKVIILAHQAMPAIGPQT